MGNDPNCNHLFQGNGAVNTVVRLPESVRFFVFNFSFVDLPAGLTICTLSVARCHLRVWLKTKFFNPTWLLAVMARRLPSIS
jgi:hypothetical protein